MVPFLPSYVNRPAGKDYYSFDYGNTHFTMMATRYGFGGGGYAFTDVTSGAQYNWIAADLNDAANDPNTDNIFVFAHHNLYPMLNGDGASSNMSTYQSVLWNGLFVPLGVDAYFHGHWHYYERSIRDGNIPMINVATASTLENACPACERNINQYQIVDINGTDIQVTVRKVSVSQPTTTFDSFPIAQRGINLNCVKADLTGDGKVNVEDFSALTIDWLRCTNPAGANCEVVP